MRKKLLFFVMTVVATVLLVPNAYAENTVIAKIGNVEYSTLQEAVNAAKTGETVTLVSDTKEDITVAADKDITLDIGTHTLTNKAGHTITNDGKLTIKGKGTIDNITHGKGALVNHGNVTVLSGTFTRSKEAGTRSGNGENSWYVIDNNGTKAVLTFKGGSVVNTSGFSSLIRNLEAKLFVEAGTFENDFIVLKNDDNGTLKVSGGKISTKKAEGSAVQNWGNFALSGGELNAVDGAAALTAYSWSDQYESTATIVDGTINGNIKISRDGNYTGKAPEVAITGTKITGDIIVQKGGKLEVVDGEIDGAITAADETVTITTQGGTYTTEPSEDMVPNGYKVFDNEDGTYTVAKTVTLTFSVNGETESVVIPAGTKLTDKEIEELKNELMKELEGTGYTFDGFYLDEDYTEAFDFKNPIKEDTTVYMKLVQKRTTEKDETPTEKNETPTEKNETVANPNTSDINIYAVIGTMLVSVAGIGYAIKKRFN